MFVSQSDTKLVARHIEQIKLGMALLFITLGISLVINPFDFWQNITLGARAVGLIIIAPAVFLLLDVIYVEITLDKVGGSQIIIRKLRYREVIDFTVKDVEKIRKKEYLGIGNGSKGPNDYLQLKIKDRELIDIAWTRQPRSLNEANRPFRREGQKMADFLGVRLEIKQIDLWKEFRKNPNQPEPN